MSKRATKKYPKRKNRKNSKRISKKRISKKHITKKRISKRHYQIGCSNNGCRFKGGGVQFQPMSDALDMADNASTTFMETLYGN